MRWVTAPAGRTCAARGAPAIDSGRHVACCASTAVVPAVPLRHTWAEASPPLCLTSLGGPPGTHLCVPAGDKKYNISSKVVKKAFGTAMAGLCFIDYVFPEIETEVRGAWGTLLRCRYALSRAGRQQQGIQDYALLEGARAGRRLTASLAH